jgi:LmbE family N-acetylglucosaminyl deacetylase
VLRFTFGAGNQRLERVLCLGAHCDDIEIGCGGTLLRLLDEHPSLEVCWVIFASDEVRRREAELSADRFLSGARSKTLITHGFRDGFFPYSGHELKDVFLRLEKEFSPDLVLTHYRHDLHQDHRLVSELTWNSFRNHLILEYEIPKYDGDLGSPNFFVPLPSDICNRKIDYLLSSFPSQRSKFWFTESTFLALLRLRGLEIRSATDFAEAFYCRKVQV